jgi:hypothetical protein
MSLSEPNAWGDVSQLKPSVVPDELREKWLRWMIYTGLKHFGKAVRIYGAWKRSGLFVSFADACDAAAETMKGQRVFADDTSR